MKALIAAIALLGMVSPAFATQDGDNSVRPRPEQRYGLANRFRVERGTTVLGTGSIPAPHSAETTTSDFGFDIGLYVYAHRFDLGYTQHADQGVYFDLPEAP